MKAASRRSAHPAVAIISAVALGALIVHGAAVIALLAPAGLGVVALIALVRVLVTWSDDVTSVQRVLWWTMAAFLLHLVFGLVVTYFSSPFNYSDAVGYHNGAVALAQHWLHGGPTPAFAAGKEGYYYTLGILYLVFGSHATVGLALNAVLSAALVPVLSDLTNRQFGREAAHYVAPLVALLPGLIMWTSPLLKEAGVVFLLAVAANCAVRLTERPTVGALAVLAASLSLLFTYRGPIAILASAGLIVGIMVSPGRSIGGLGTGLSAAGAIAVFVVAFGLGLTGYRSAVHQSNLGQVSTVRQDLATSAKSGFDPQADVSTTSGALSYAPRGIFNFLLGPAPWQVHSLAQAAALPDVAVWWCLFPSLLRGVWAGGRRIGSGAFVLGLPAVLLVFTLAIVAGNFGLVVRERAQVVVLLIPFIALGLAERAARREVGQPDARTFAS